MSDTKLYSYLMTHDSGFAPNPFHGHLTLATCMTDIRRTKKVGQWVAGFASKALVKKCKAIGISIPYQGLIYLMEIGEIMTLDCYFRDPRFQQKKAIPLGSNNLLQERGDNIYYANSDGQYTQLENDNHDIGEFDKDTRGRNVLIAKQFYYFGRNCIVPKESWTSMNINVPDRYIAYGSESDGDAVGKLVDYLRLHTERDGALGLPCIWDAVQGQKKMPAPDKFATHQIY
ncbi:hypothetical protein [Undibacterium sp.]|uniref:Nmad2 family putative nucleotide modification protein n=1 Tax=Undibacterium sp. TaxID=1914977 RepID=UPI0037513853